MNRENAVPTTLFTVTFTAATDPTPPPVAHEIVVALDHAVVKHAVSSSVAVGELVRYPKFKPLIVTDAPCEVGPFFGITELTAGAEKLNI